MSDDNTANTVNTEVSVLKTAKNNRKLIPVIAGIVVLIALITGVSMYNTPVKRMHRHLDLANKYLEEMNYEQAVVEFDKAVAIEPMNADAYLGKAQAYVGLDNYDMAIETLEEGYLATQEDSGVKENLINIYRNEAENGEGTKTYEERLAVYDRLLELGEQKEDVLNGLEECLEQYLSALLAEGKSDEAQLLMEKYRDILAGTEFDYFRALAEVRLREIGYGPLLRAMQDLIVAEDYEQANELVQQQEYQDMIASLEEDASYYYGEYDQNGMRSGLGIGVYVGRNGAYFYYGSWSEGVRSGHGQAYHPTPDKPQNIYGIYTGEWENDLPNGEGEERYQVIQDALEENSGNDSVLRGFYKDGLYNGEIFIEVTWYDRIDTYHGTAEDGVWKLLGETVDGEAVVWSCDDGESSGMWVSLDDNKDAGPKWLLPLSYWKKD